MNGITPVLRTKPPISSPDGAQPHDHHQAHPRLGPRWPSIALGDLQYRTERDEALPMTRWSLFLASLLLLATPSARAEGVVKLHAAGSLRAAFTELAQSFTAATGIGVETNFGASGLLREALAHEASGDVFA